ncbi:MAG: LysR family transcriptional regulator, partial [Oscillospiraceae bacterium]
MNLLHLRYAVEVDSTRSITKAAENLFMGQPNLSRAIRELEETVGVTLFRRTSRGIVPTPQGEEFLAHARRVLDELDDMEARYRPDDSGRTALRISMVRADYLAQAFCTFAASP